MKKRRRPRTCVACKTARPKTELIRVVRSPDGRVYVDLTGRGQGRGAYICSARNCIELAKKKNLISRALKVDVPFEIYEELLQKHKELLQKIDNIGNANQ
ncbi:RNase P modulator RnpM [Acetomicrobium sp.]|uniref:RNase P modulator RnpM n=1 Tax=Acetomicrobium sp. TaxID=1872099 RepID=UPI002B25938B|nr:YlxR family protein [Acetomicrobium sp.]